MRKRFTGAVVAVTIAAAGAVFSLTVMPLSGQGAAGGGQGRGAAAAAPAAARPARIAGHPNLNGIYQAMGSANWNLEDHSASGLGQFWQLGAIAAIPAGMSVVEGGTIPYKPEALKKRDENRAGWPKTD